MGKSVRIIVADDFEPFRELVCSTLQDDSELQVVCQVENGLDAVQKAEELRPDLILLDIGLPQLSGIEAARRIRNLAPDSKILFVSQQSSSDVMQEALDTGACGYVVKSDVGRELLEAIGVVLRGGRFIGRIFASHEDEAAVFDDIPHECALGNSVLADRGLCENVAGRHEMNLYADEEMLLTDVINFIDPALRAGNAVIAIFSESHQESLLRRLEVRGGDWYSAVEEGRGIVLDASKTLASFMINGVPDTDRFLKTAGEIITSAAQSLKGKHSRVVACGECAPVLWHQGSAGSAIRVEQLWNQIMATYDLDILCHYPLDSLSDQPSREMFHRMCAEHSAVHGR